MGKAARAACVITPMALTIASLICLLLVMIGQLSNNRKAPPALVGRNLYFLKADTSKFTVDPQTVLDKVENASNGINKNTDILDAMTDNASSKALKDFYMVGLWSYCEGDNADGIEETTYCSPPSIQFWFDPTDVWGLTNTSVQNVLGYNLQKGLDAYRRVVKWMGSAFIVATALTAAEFFLCFFTIHTRRASLLTFILSVTSSICAIVAATIATAAYGVLTGVFHTALESYNVDVLLGREMLLVLWLGVALRVASGPFWLPTVCCCKP